MVSGSACNRSCPERSNLRRAVVCKGLGATLLASVLLLVPFVAPGVASAEALTITIEPLKPEQQYGEPIGIGISGTADGLHRLFAFAAPSDDTCPYSRPGEAGFPTSMTWLSPEDGVPLGAGPFAVKYTFTPYVGEGSPVCAYLTDSMSDLPDASAFAQLDLGIRAPYLQKASEGMRQLTIEHEQLLEHEAAERRREQEERERRPASELVKESPLKAAVHCVVPQLVGHTLKIARSLLAHVHCRLGKIGKPTHSHGKARLVVSHQGRRRGAKLPAGTSINIQLRRT